MNVYHRKLYALLHNPDVSAQADEMSQRLQCFQGYCNDLKTWWEQSGYLATAIGSSSDRVNLKAKKEDNISIFTKHPISGQSQSVLASDQSEAFDIKQVIEEQDVEKVFWWFWRFYPEICASNHPDALLFPAHKILPDCPLHSYRSTVSALTGAMFPAAWESGKHVHPYLLLFTFSPVQEFIKSSRKFLDFWAGSYLLHYLSVKLCWQIAAEYGPDAVITPSLWSQEIVDALLVQKYPEFSDDFALQKNPVSQFDDKKSTSLSTAGFPNAIAVLVPGQKAAKDLGEKLAETLKAEWAEIAKKVRQDIKEQVIQYLSDTDRQKLGEVIDAVLPTKKADPNPYWRDLEKWQQHGCWEWNRLWDAQINNTWEGYWTAVPIGHPDREVMIHKDSQNKFDDTWTRDQEAIAPSRSGPIPTAAEEEIYTDLNVGTWWGNTQALLGRLIQSVKNTRSWQIPAAPGERSTLSGQFSAVHPNLLYNEQFREGGGLPSGSMRLFWRVMAEVYPGLFNGSEKLNAIELTKRMAWVYGGVAKSLGINVDTPEGQVDYERFIRFPNLSSVASARFAHDHPERVQQYWENLSRSLHRAKEVDQTAFTREQIDAFYAKSCRPFHVPKTDEAIAQKLNNGKKYNGVMFSSKWLADDMGLNTQVESSSTKQVEVLRRLVETAHKQSGFGEGSPSDWWVIVLADGDDMGKYVSGKKLKPYKDYVAVEKVDEKSHQVAEFDNFLNKTRKRMGPATHVGLNRALLDFSNRLVPHITEHRFCGKVVYSGGDDVMAVLPLADLPGFLRSLRMAWCGGEDPDGAFESKGGYWLPNRVLPGLPQRPHFTMGEGATMSMGIVVAHKSIPLPTVLESLWTAEKERAKKLPGKDGLCFRVIYGGGNTLEAIMKGVLLEHWWQFIQQAPDTNLSPLLYRLAEDLPRHAAVTEDLDLFCQAAQVILARSETGQKLDPTIQKALLTWLSAWDEWAWQTQQEQKDGLGAQPDDLGKLLRFSAFWVDKMVQQAGWVKSDKEGN